MRHPIIVIGAGFAGVNAALAAARTLGDPASVLLVSPTPAMTIRPRLYEAGPEGMTVDLPGLIAKIGIAFRVDSLTGLDERGHTIRLASGASLQFSRLVLAVGSRMAVPPLPGAELAHSIDDLAAAVEFDQAMRRLAWQRAPTIAVIGAGFTGIELVLELRPRLIGLVGQRRADAARLMLFDRAQQVGAELGAGPRPAIVEALRVGRVELRLGAAIEQIRSTGLRLSDGSEVETDLTVLCTGLIASDATSLVDGPRDTLGRLLLDGHLRVPVGEHIFAAGDAGSAVADGGHRTLMSCQHALATGRVAGENAARDLLGQALLTYRHPRYITCLDLGASGAVVTDGWDRRLRMVGAEAKSLKRKINEEMIYPPTGSGEVLLAASEIPPDHIV